MFKEKLKKIIPEFFLDYYHFLLAFSAALFYWFPSRKLKVIGVTGTNGKSTTISLLFDVLKQAGLKTAYFSSVKSIVGERETTNNLRMTMPGPFRLQRFLKKAAAEKHQYAIIEVTSEGIKQHRHRFIDFYAAIFTNLSPEHIEAHQGFANYRSAKLELFKAAKEKHIINIDDENSSYFWNIPAKEKIGYSLIGKSDKPLVLMAERIDSIDKGIAFKVKGMVFSVKLLGDFNIYNCLAAIAFAFSEGVSLEICRQALVKSTFVPGRMEEIISQPFQIVIDYAFTPNALEKVYQTLKKDGAGLICVLGSCGGGRDKWKRPVLGKLAAQYCRRVIVTNEDPYDEDPEEIIDQVLAGTDNKGEKMTDRREAINLALRSAKPGETVVITGKGCEPSICLAGGKRIDWSDKATATEEFEKLTGTKV